MSLRFWALSACPRRWTSISCSKVEIKTTRPVTKTGGAIFATISRPLTVGFLSLSRPVFLLWPARNPLIVVTSHPTVIVERAIFVLMYNQKTAKGP